MVDMRRELEHMHRKGTAFIQRTVGEAVVWWEYDAVESAYDHVYDEPSMIEKRVWQPSILVPIPWINESEGARVNEASGRLVTNDIRFGVSVRVLRDVGLSSPTDSRRHLNDLLLYRRRLWSISVYNIRGRIARDSVMVGVVATDLKPHDAPFDSLPSFAGLTFTDRPMGFPSSSFDDQTFDNHELPAHHTPTP